MTSPCSHVAITKEFPPGVFVTQEEGFNVTMTAEVGVSAVLSGVEVYCRAPIIVFDFIYDGDWQHDGIINHGGSVI